MMKQTLIIVFALALLGAACSEGDELEAAPSIVIEGASGAESASGTVDDDGSTGTAATTDDEAGSDTGSGSDTGASDTGTRSDEDIALEFAQCMRDNGVPEFPDPTVDADGAVDFGGPDGPDGVDTAAQATTDAFDVCGELLADASFLPGAQFTDAEIEDNLLAFAQCMRDLGFDLTDPDLSGGIGPGAGGPAQIFGAGFDPTDPATQDAAQECQAVFAPGFGPGGAG